MEPSLQASYEHALLLFSPSAIRASSGTQEDTLIRSLIVDSDYAGILREYAASFQVLDRHMQLSFPAETNSLIKLVVAIAALQAFIQTNWTGPMVECDPAEILLGDEPEASTSKAGHTRSDSLNAVAVGNLSMGGEPAYHLAKKAGFLWLAKEILVSLTDAADLPSIPVWQLRLGLVNLRLLDTPVSLKPALIQAVQGYSDSLPGGPSSTSTSTLLDLRTSLTLLVGLYHTQFVYFSSSATKLSSETFYTAAQLAKLEYELTGRMGKKTRFQIDEKSQLVVLARSRTDRDDGWQARERMSLEAAKPAETKTVIDSNGEEVEVTDVLQNAAGVDQPKHYLLGDDTLLERTHFTSTMPTQDGNAEASGLLSLDPSNQPVLHPLDETVLLALSLSITNTSPAHGLTTEQIHAFVTRVLDDGSQNWSIHSMGLLLRSRLEANRSRTVERGLLQIQSLVDQLKLESVAKPVGPDDLDLEKGATPLERLQYFWCMDLPSTWELERELATRYLGLGVTRSAMEIFTRLEMWEDVAKCYSSLGEEQKAIQVVKDLLAGKLLESETTMAYSKSPAGPRKLSAAQKAKLYCLLGDLERMPEHYETAWEISAQSSSRAMRSLGQSFFQVGDYTKAQACLDKALAINPLFGKVWFVLGCAAMRNEDWTAAERAFRRCTALDEDDGESWNNLATVVLRQTGPTAAKPDHSVTEVGESTGIDVHGIDVEEANYDRKRTAFTCLGQAIKHSYDSWRVWVNYLLVSVDVGELMEACRAMARLCELRAEKDGETAVDLEILDRLVAVVCKDAATAQSGQKPVNGHASLSDNFASTSTHADCTRASNVQKEDMLTDLTAYAATQRGLAGRVKSLFETAILPRITDSSRIYSSYARLLFALGDLSGSLQATMKAYRVDVVLNEAVSTNKVEFERAAERVTETVDTLRNLGEKDLPGKDGEVVMKDWKTQARSIVRTFLGRTKETFGEEESWLLLQEELKELKSA